MLKVIALHGEYGELAAQYGKKAADEVFQELEARENRIKQIKAGLFAIPAECAGAAVKNLLSESLGTGIPASEKTEAVIRAENLILKAILEMGI